MSDKAKKAHDSVPNFMTFDIEEWYHANYESVDASRFKKRHTNLSQLVDLLIEDMAQHGVVATCFIVGEVAQKYPEVVRKLHKAGHEIASHSMKHRLVYSLTKDEFLEDTKQSCEILEDLIGTKVTGYRAPSWSVNEDIIQWYYEVLTECGLRYSSSVFPVKNYLYGIPHANPYPHRNTKSAGIVEIPCSTVPLVGNRFGFSGGFYMRLFPAWFVTSTTNRINSSGQPAVFYLHPREIDQNQEKLDLPRLENVVHYWNIGGTRKKLNTIMKTFQNSFITMNEYALNFQA